MLSHVPQRKMFFLSADERRVFVQCILILTAFFSACALLHGSSSSQQV